MIDDRLAGAYVALGYHVFPFDGFDQNGRVVVPGDMQVPPGLQADFGAAQSAPVWQEVFRRLSVLDNIDPAWRCYALGVGFGGGGIRLMPAKSLDSVSSPQAAAGWVNSYGSVLITGIREVAGRRHVIQPSWLAALRAVLNLFSSVAAQSTAPQGAADEGRTPGEAGADEKYESSPPGGSASDSQQPLVSAATFSPVLAVSVILGLLEAASSLTMSQNVLSTNLWYVPRGWGAMTEEQTVRWSSLAPASEWANGARAVNAIWSAENKIIWHWNHQHPWDKPWSSLDMPHTPDQVWSAFYPAGFSAETGGAAEARLMEASHEPDA